MDMNRWILLWLMMAMGSSALGKCAVLQRQEGVSPNGHLRLLIHASGDFKLFRKEPSGSYSLQVAKRTRLWGHHLRIHFSEDGRFFALIDDYEGFEVYSASGTRLASAAAEEILTPRELTRRPGKWACHPEGTWLRSHSFGSRRIDLVLHSGRKVRLGW
jgi:hypothetical protein